VNRIAISSGWAFASWLIRDNHHQWHAKKRQELISPTTSTWKYLDYQKHCYDRGISSSCCQAAGLKDSSLNSIEPLRISTLCYNLLVCKDLIFIITTDKTLVTMSCGFEGAHFTFSAFQNLHHYGGTNSGVSAFWLCRSSNLILHQYPRHRVAGGLWSGGTASYNWRCYDDQVAESDSDVQVLRSIMNIMEFSSAFSVSLLGIFFCHQ
jgi:hypothetical protein